MAQLQSELPSGIRITPIRAFSDNYIWCLHNDHSLVVVDPGDAEPVLAFCRQNSLTLEAILITHHHHDHTGGITQLVSTKPDIPVIGPAGGHIRGLSKSVDEGDTLHLPVVDCEFTVLEVPGHTLDHIAFVGHGLIFCGDTLFAAGCGRLFEGSPAQMLHSLNKIKRLPDDTWVYCAHEYTQANVRFALAVDPDNQALQTFKKNVDSQRKHDEPTVPTRIKSEKAINPFLRSQDKTVKHAAEHYTGRELDDEIAVFTAIREWKNEF